MPIFSAAGALAGAARTSSRERRTHAPHAARTIPPRNRFVAKCVAPSTSAAALAQALAELERDGDHRRRAQLDVELRHEAGGDRGAQVGGQLVDPGGGLGLLEHGADRARVAGQERRPPRVLDDEGEVGPVGVLDERLAASPPRGGRRARAAAPPRRPRARARGTPTPCRGSSCRTCPPRAPSGARCRARSPRRSRARRTRRAPRRGSRSGWRPWWPRGGRRRRLRSRGDRGGSSRGTGSRKPCISARSAPALRSFAVATIQSSKSTCMVWRLEAT